MYVMPISLIDYNNNDEQTTSENRHNKKDLIQISEEAKQYYDYKCIVSGVLEKRDDKIEYFKTKLKTNYPPPELIDGFIKLIGKNIKNKE